MKILFLHGWNSVVGGVKPTYLKDHGHEVINPALPHEDFAEAVRIAQAEFDKHRPVVVVGSNRGGGVAMNINTGEAKLVLLCPAWKKWGTAKAVRPHTMILHSRADDVIPYSDSEELAKNSGLPGCALIEIGNDHRLVDPESLDMMLHACQVGENKAIEDLVDILVQDWTGLCYTAALQWVRESEDQDWVVVHGTVWSDQVGKYIEHAWCEFEDLVVDLAMPVGSRVIDRVRYYVAAQPKVKKIYPSGDALLLAIKNRHDGPWDESEQISEITPC